MSLINHFKVLKIVLNKLMSCTMTWLLSWID
jgi:hypothetical protein